MTVSYWCVIVNMVPYDVEARYPWTAVTKALKLWKKDNPDSSMTVFEIHLANVANIPREITKEPATK